MSLKILIVEDNTYKRQRIIEIIRSDFNDYHITESYSFTTAWKLISKNLYDIVILDMSLPTFDKIDANSGGTFRVFGGKELACKMEKRNIASKFIFITQYKNFSDNINSYAYDDLKKELLNRYNSNCLGFILYSNTKSEWRNELIELMKSR